jgi:hypothetical protein
LSNSRTERRIKREQRLISSAAHSNRTVRILTACYPASESLRPFFDVLRPNQAIAGVIKEFRDKNFEGKTVIGVHIRYYDTSLPESNHTKYWLNREQSLESCVTRIQAAVESVASREYVVFLATDSKWVSESVKQRIEQVVTFEKRFGTDGTRELHEEIPTETAMASVAEMFLLAATQLLVRYPPGSWFSHYASLYVKEWP